MYDAAETVDRYDTATTSRKLSTFRSPVELEFLDMVEALDIKSVFDIGCGAGAFYHLLSSVSPNMVYQGIDLSTAQIERARLRFGNMFEVRDVRIVSEEEFSKYDAVHAYSVFTFLSSDEQLSVLRRIVRSGARLLTEFGVTEMDNRFAPRSCFKNFGNRRLDGQELMTTISFPLRADLEKAVASSSHTVSYRETTYGGTRAINRNLNLSGGVLANKAQIKRKRGSLEKWMPFQKQLRLKFAKISPTEWREHRPEEYDRLSPDEIYDALMGRLE